MNLERIESVSHRLETLFGRARNGEIKPTPAFYNLVYRALDALCDLVRESGGLAPAAKHDLAGLLVRLDAANTAAEVAPEPASPPAVPEPPIAPPVQVAPAPPAPREASAPPAARPMQASARPLPVRGRRPSKSRCGSPRPSWRR